MLIVNFRWISTGPKYPSLGCMDSMGYYEAVVLIEGILVVLGRVNSNFLRREYQQDFFAYDGQTFPVDQWPKIKEQIKQEIVATALATAKENLCKLKATEEPEDYRVVDK